MASRNLIRYLAPFFIYLALSSFQGGMSGVVALWFYGLKAFLSFCIFALFFKGHWKEIEGHFDGWAVVLGLVVLGIWVPFCKMFQPAVAGSFDPTIFSSQGQRTAALLIRLAGSSVWVPLVEEIVWRSFLMRFLIKNDFLEVPLGAYRFFSFSVTALSFALVHPSWQWGPALIAGLAYGLYLVKTKNLRGCIWAHATTNLGLGLYVIVTGDWGLWG